MKFLQGTCIAAASLIAAALATPASATPLIATLTLSTSGDGPTGFNLGSCPTSLIFGSSCQLGFPNTGAIGTTLDTISFIIGGEPSGPVSGSLVITEVGSLVGGIYKATPGGVTSDTVFADGAVATAHFGASFNFTFTPAPTSVPEPLTLSVFGAGLAGAFAARRKARKS